MQTFKRSTDIECKVLPDGHIVLVSPKTKWAYTLNAMGAIVWEFCDGNTLEDILEQIRQLEQLPLSTDLTERVTELLNELVEMGLICSDQQSSC